MSPAGPVESYDSKSYRLREILPSAEECYWFIPESEEEDLLVFDLTCDEIEKLIAACPFFEYYVVNKQNQWFVAESDHNQFQVCRSSATSGTN